MGYFENGRVCRSADYLHTAEPVAFAEPAFILPSAYPVGTGAQHQIMDITGVNMFVGDSTCYGWTAVGGNHFMLFPGGSFRIRGTDRNPFRVACCIPAQ